MSGKVKIPRCRHNMTSDAIPFHECVKDEAEKWIEVDKKVDQMMKDKMIEEDTANEENHVKNKDNKDNKEITSCFISAKSVMSSCMKSTGGYLLYPSTPKSI